MDSSSNSRSSRCATENATRSQGVVQGMNDLLKDFINDKAVTDFTVIHEPWPRFLNISPVNFDSIPPQTPCIHAGVNAQPRGVLKYLPDISYLTRVDF